MLNAVSVMADVTQVDGIPSQIAANLKYSLCLIRIFLPPFFSWGPCCLLHANHTHSFISQSNSALHPHSSLQWQMRSSLSPYMKLLSITVVKVFLIKLLDFFSASEAHSILFITGISFQFHWFNLNHGHLQHWYFALLLTYTVADNWFSSL